jgi:peptidyl-prolyl cis-trans isomerase C
MNHSMQNTKLGLSLVLAVAWLWTGCEKKASAPAGPTILATVGSQVITADDLQNEAARLLAGKQSLPDKTELLKKMIERLALVERAKAANLATDLETRRAMDGILISKLREKELETKLAKIELTEEEIRQAYDATQAKFTKTAQVRLAILFQEMTAKTPEATKTEIRQRLEEGVQKAQTQSVTGGRGPAASGFGAVAVDYSSDQVSRYRGGDIGWLETGNYAYHWPRSVLEVGYALEKGKMSGILEAENGLYVITKTDAREGSTTSFQEAKPGLIQTVLASKRRLLEEQFLKETASLFKSEIKSDTLASVQLPVSAGKSTSPKADAPPPSLPGALNSASKSDTAQK